ncbi:MAG: TlpA family protein disulfide reductase [Acidobacteria bacterium]|nr:TlpA family protein disulfide reductase [Acidobacteriota bacterium]
MHTLGTICGYLFVSLRSPLNLVPTILGGTLVLFMLHSGWGLWIHKLNYGTFTGLVVAEKMPTEFVAIDEKGNLKTDESFRGKIVLLDFWYTTCGACFIKFPHVQSVYQKYKKNPFVEILAVNKPIEEDGPNQAFEVVKNAGYSFPVVIVKDEEMPEKWGVKFYPTTFVINQNGLVVFRGDIEKAIGLVDELSAVGR